jgi:tungstate transport system ATP-binding protein
MGHNGCGKSTFLRICSLLEQVDEGKVEFFSDGVVLDKDISLRRRICLVLPRVGVFNTTVFKNAAFGLKVRGVGRREIAERVHSALVAVGLSGKKEQNALTLSSGETQRLGLARAMVIEPGILFLDEPTASIDRENTEIVEEIILNMKKEGKTTIIISTHDRSQAEKLADTVILMNDGRIGPIK